MEYIYTTYDQTKNKLTLFDGKRDCNIDIKSLVFIDGYAIVNVPMKKDKSGHIYSIVTVVNGAYHSVMYPIKNVEKAALLPGGNLLISTFDSEKGLANVTNIRLNPIYSFNYNDLDIHDSDISYQTCQSCNVLKIVDGSKRYIQLLDCTNGLGVRKSRLYCDVGDFWPQVFINQSQEIDTINTANACIGVPYEYHGNITIYRLFFQIDEEGNIISQVYDEYFGDLFNMPNTEEKIKEVIARRGEMASKEAKENLDRQYCIQ